MNINGKLFLWKIGNVAFFGVNEYVLWRFGIKWFLMPMAAWVLFGIAAFIYVKPNGATVEIASPQEDKQ